LNQQVGYYWSSSDENVATVNSDGKVKGVSAGTATISVRSKDGKTTASYTFTVYSSSASLKSITLYNGITNNSISTTKISIPTDKTSISADSLAQKTITSGNNTYVFSGNVYVTSSISEMKTPSTGGTLIKYVRYSGNTAQYSANGSSWENLGRNIIYYSYNQAFQADTGNTGVEINQSDWPYTDGTKTTRILLLKLNYDGEDHLISTQYYDSSSAYDYKHVRNILFNCDNSLYSVGKVTVNSSYSGSSYDGSEVSYDATSGTSVDFTYGTSRETITVTATLVEKKFNVSYDNNGGTGDISDTNSYSNGRTVTISSKEPTYEGHVFLGWSYGNHMYQAGDTVVVDKSDVNFVAQWAPVSKMVIYEAEEGGSVSNSKDYIVNDDALIGSTAVADTANGYTFDGWYNGNNKVSGSATFTPTEKKAATYTAKFVRQDVTLYFHNSSSGTTITSVTGKRGDTIAAGVSDNVEIDLEAAKVFVKNGGYGISAETVDAAKSLADLETLGFTFTFDGWCTAAHNGGVFLAEGDSMKTLGVKYNNAAYKNEAAQIFGGATADVYAHYNITYKANYKVEFINADTLKIIKSVNRSALVNSTASVTESDKSVDGYTYAGDDYSGTVLSGSITGDGKLVLKLYFHESCLISYQPGDHGTFAAQTTADLTYGTAMPAFNGETTGEAGYTFAGWSPAVADKVTGSATYVAQWTANSDTAYNVEWIDADTQKTIKNTEKRSGTTAEPASVTESDKSVDGYTYAGDDYSGTVLSGSITGDGNLTLKVYFKKNVTILAASGSHVYDANEFSLNNTYENVSGLPEGYSIKIVTDGKITNVGSVTNNISSVVITNKNNEVVTDLYNVMTLAGTLTVTQKSVTVTADKSSKVFGTIDPSFTAKTDGTLNGDKLTYAVSRSGTDEAVGTYKGAVVAVGEASQGNYNVTYVPADFTITTNTKDLGLTAESNGGVYNGSAYTLKNVAATGTAAEGAKIEYKVGKGDWSTTAPSATNVSDSVTDISVRVSKTGYQTVEIDNLKITVTPASMTITTPDANKVYDGSALTAEGTIDGLVDGEAAFTTTGTRTIVGSTKNTYSLTWNEGFSADNYDITENLGTLTVSKIQNAVTITSGTTSKTYDGTALQDSSFTSTGLPEGYAITIKSTASITNVGSRDNTFTYVIKDAADNDVTANFANVTPVSGKLTVNKRNVILTSASDSKSYDGKALTNKNVSVTGDGFAKGEGASYSVTGSQKETGTSDNTFTYDLNGKTDAGNYSITTALGKLTVAKSDDEIVITSGSTGKTYDGTVLTDSSFTSTGKLPEGYKINVTPTASIKDAGSTENTFTYMITDGNNNDVTANFAKITAVYGTLTVAKRPLTITTSTVSKEYDGTAVTSAGTINGLVDGEAAFTTTGSQTEVGSSDNTYSLTWNNGFSADNYEVTENVGKLTVSKIKQEVTITSNDASKPYDGTELTDGSFTSTGLPEGYQINVTPTASITGAGSKDNTFTYTITDAAGNDVTANFANVTVANGTLTVTKKALTITTDSADKTYDSSALTAAGTIDGLVDGEAVFTVTGTQTAVGSTKNTYSLTWNEGFSADNYDITENLGTLTVDAIILPVVPVVPVNPTAPTTPTNGGTFLDRVTAEAQAATPEQIQDDASPKATPEEETIDEESSAKDSADGTWSLVNFTLMNLSVFESIMLLAGYFISTKNQKELEEDEKKKTKKKGLFRLISLPIAIIAVVAFVLTEDINLKTVFIDKWTIWMALIAVVQTVMVALSRKKIVDDDDDEEKADANQDTQAQA
jgi:uncharacterized repeat protein (TIGR02543 family)